MASAVAATQERIAATRRVCLVIDRMADDPVDPSKSRLSEHPAFQDVDIRDVWPAFSTWMIAGEGKKQNGAMIEMTTQMAAIQEHLRHLMYMLHASTRGLVIEQVWRDIRGELGVLSHDWFEDERHAGNSTTANAIAERTPHIRIVTNAAEAGADIAWTMYCADKWIENASTLAVRYAGEAWGWWGAQAQWNKSMAQQPSELWRPQVAAGRRDFARRAKRFLLETVT